MFPTGASEMEPGPARGASSWRPSMRGWSRWMRRAALCARLSATGGSIYRRPAQQTILRRRYEQTSPPAVIGDLIVVGSAIADNNSTVGRPAKCVRSMRAPGAALDLESGAAGSGPIPGTHVEGCGGSQRRRQYLVHHRGGSERDLVFLPTSSPAVDYYGVTRLGDNRYANSVVALRAATGTVAWHFQTVHHDLWDYDNAAPPALITLPGGRDAVLQGTKTAQLFVLDRETGAPLFPVEERAVPKSDCRRGDLTHAAAVGDVDRVPHAHGGRHLGRTPEDLAECRARFATLRYDGPFTPPSERGSVMLPANIGGAHWGGVAYDRERGIAIVPNNRLAAVVKLIPRETWKAMAGNSPAVSASARNSPTCRARLRHAARNLAFEQAFACTAPPFGTLTGISLDRQDALGRAARHRRRTRQDRPAASRGGGMVNLGGPSPPPADSFSSAQPWTPMCVRSMSNGSRALEIQAARGWQGNADDISRSDGRQYVVISAGGDGKSWGKRTPSWLSHFRRL